MKSKATEKHGVERNIQINADRNFIAEMFRGYGGGRLESCISKLERNGAIPINKDALVETVGGATGQLKHLLK